jgi:hydrogenase maturation protease
MKMLVIGVGNDYRGDDAAGLLVARRIRELHLPHVEVLESDGEFTELMESWKAAESVILIDAVQSGATPGTIHRVDVRAQTLPANWWQSSTHAFGVAEAIELSKAFGQLPTQFSIIGIEGSAFAVGAALTEPVANAIAEVVGLIRQEIRTE